MRVFCDGINKILVPTRPARTTVIVTGPATSLRDTTNVPTSELCEYLARTPAPIDFGRSAVEFLTSQNMPLAQLSGTGLTDKIYHDILPYLQAGNLRDFEGTRLAQIIISEFDPDAKISSVRSLGVDLASASEFRLQPLRVTAFTTVHGDTFQLQSDRALLPFGEVEYFHEQVLSGPGKAFLSDDYSEFVKRTTIADVDVELAKSVAVNLIDATSKMADQVAPPSGIGGGTSAFLLDAGTERFR